MIELELGEKAETTLLAIIYGEGDRRFSLEDKVLVAAAARESAEDQLFTIRELLASARSIDLGETVANVRPAFRGA